MKLGGRSSDAKAFRSYVCACVCIMQFIFALHALFLPGDGPRDFAKGDRLKVKLQKKLASVKFQLPYSYYPLPHCRPKFAHIAENTRESFRRDLIENSPYEFKMREQQMCNVVCRTILEAKDAKEFKEKIDHEYRVNMILDNLPLVMPYKRTDMDSLVYQHGFPIGVKMEQKYFINNHLTFIVKYHKDEETDAARVVGFEVKPFSVKHEYEGKWNDKIRLTNCDPHAKRIVTGNDSPLEVEDEKELIFTYDVEFQETEIKWASRWDTYLYLAGADIHWFSIFNFLLVVLFLGGMVSMITWHTIDRDFYKYYLLETQEEIGEEIGWTLVLGDVFRPPTNSDLLCVYAGTGVQCFGTILVTMVFAALGFFSPSSRGGLMTTLPFLWVFMGLFAGYTSARLYKMFKGTEWKKIALKTSFMCPGIVFVIFSILNALSWGEGSSGAVPFGTMFALALLWFGISVPLVFVGSYVGHEKPAIKDPVRTNKNPRQIPKQAWFVNPVFNILIGGILPFSAVSVELFFIFTSIWFQQFYCIWGFLFLVFFILIIICADITIVLCYFQLCREDYSWWWRSYLTSGSSALYVFLYATFYFTKLNITKPVLGILYFGYVLIGSYAFFVLTGTIGFFSCFWFTRRLYSSIEIDRKVEAFKSRV